MPDDAPVIPPISYGFARRNGVLLQGAEGGLVCRHRDGLTLDTILEVQRVAGGEVAFARLDDPAFDALVDRTYGDSASDASEAAADADTGADLASLADSAAEVDDLLESRDDAPVVRLINALLLQAVREGASDIHVEMSEKALVVRFRVDGVLRDALTPKRALAPLLVSRIKVMARLDIAEKRLPQDGRVSLRVGGHDLDVRVSTLPSQYGERVVMRLLDRSAALLGLDRIGMTGRDHAAFLRILDRPHGVVLVTGPTGSGKTTTLYGALSHLNDRQRNIMTVEDPIEYALPGIAQTQVDTRTKLTFARGLRAILRQDPDVIMVGEIRDTETAKIAVQASMTGHLMLSTLHTNSAIGAVTRLLDMGVERFLLAPMLNGLVAQRLVRRLCETCRRADTATGADSALLGGALAAGDPVWRAAGCAECGGQGYRGRTAVYEVIAVDAGLERLIHDGAGETALGQAAREAGPSLLDDAVAKVRVGITGVEEAARVVRND